MTWRVRRRWIGALAAAGIAFAVSAADAAPASAEVSGPCQGTIKGVDVAPLSSSDIGDAIEVGKTETVTVGATAGGEIDRYKIQLAFAGVNWTVAKGEADGSSWSKTVNVGDYARYGVGLYKVSGVSSGVSCTGAALVKVDGSPFGSVAGIVGAALSVVGVGAVASSAFKGFKCGTGLGALSPASVADPARSVESLIADIKSPRSYVDTVQSICTYNPTRYPPFVERICGTEFRPLIKRICFWG